MPISRTLRQLFHGASVAGGPYYYRIIINDWKLKYTIYSSTRSTDLFAAIPEGILKPNRSYMWRVEVYDDPLGMLTIAPRRVEFFYHCEKKNRDD